MENTWNCSPNTRFRHLRRGMERDMQRLVLVCKAAEEIELSRLCDVVGACLKAHTEEPVEVVSADASFFTENAAILQKACNGNVVVMRTEGRLVVVSELVSLLWVALQMILDEGAFPSSASPPHAP